MSNEKKSISQKNENSSYHILAQRLPRSASWQDLFNSTFDSYVAFIDTEKVSNLEFTKETFEHKWNHILRLITQPLRLSALGLT